MPEIKRNFLQGKMNKDLDERLVPNGQYRDALNIEISTSEDSNVGSVQNILGNKYINNYPNTAFESTFFPNNPTCVGSISDEKTDSIYWLVTGDELIPPHYHNGSVSGSIAPFSQHDMIIQYKDGDIKPVFVDINKFLVSSSGLSGGGNNTIIVPNLNNIGVGMTVTGLQDDGSNINTLFSTTVTGIGNFIVQNIPWSANYSMVAQPNPTANPNNPFQVAIEGVLDDGLPPPAPQIYSPVSPPTLLIYAQFPGQIIGVGDIVSGTGIPVGTEVTNVVYPSSYPGNIEVTIDQTPSVNGSYPWFTQVNFISPGSTIQVPVINNIITVSGASPSSLGLIQGMEVVGPGIPSGTTIDSINGNDITLSNTPLIGSAWISVLGSSMVNEITVADDTAGGYPPTDYLLFTRDEVLNFNKDTFITGLNIIDDMLFWTDNHSEPKKINIPRSLEGTDESGTQHTNLINKSRNIDNVSNVTPIEEKHITVIKKAPTNPPLLNMISEIGGEGNVMGNDPTNAFTDSNSSSGIVSVGDTVTGLPILTTSGELNTGDIVLFNELSTNATSSLPSNFYIRGELIQLSQTAPVNGAYLWDVKILWVSVNTPVYTQVTGWKVMVDISSINKLFKLKFPRFATRYKYEDGEYSTFSPFSEIGFVPGDFRYKPKEGFNLGMENTITEIELQDLVPKNIPKDVVQVDILYKESNSPNVYLVDSIKPDDPNEVGGIYNSWNDPIGIGSSIGVYKITSDTLYAAVPANQLLRSWDNVPRKALGQEVTANRIVYGNYLQNYDLDRIDDTTFKAEFNTSIKSYASWRTGGDLKSIKTQREYQVGITYFDQYGRETPILSSKSGTVAVPKNKCGKINRIAVQPQGSPPKFATAFKYYIKENSNEYYNLAMDRFYDADDGNIWISFYSYDRNKVDEDTWIELKKTLDSVAVLEENKYKILAIENEAPEFIKTTRSSLGKSTFTNTPSPSLLWDNSSSPLTAPVESTQKFVISKDIADTLGWKDLDTRQKISVQFSDLNGNKTQWYKVSTVVLVPAIQAIASSDDDYQLTLEKPLGSDAGFIETSASTLSNLVLNDYITLEIVQNIVDEDPEFDGRFFVKIQKDTNLEEHVLQHTFDDNYITSHANTLYYFAWTDHDALNLPTDYQSSLDLMVVNPLWSAHFGDGTTSDSNAVDPGTGNMINSPKWFIDGLGYECIQVGVYDPTNNPPVLNYGNYDAWGNLMSTTTAAVPGDGGYREYSKECGNANNPVLDISFSGIMTDTSQTTAETDYSMSFAVGTNVNAQHETENNMVEKLTTPGQRFRFIGDTEIYTIQYTEKTQIWNYVDTGGPGTNGFQGFGAGTHNQLDVPYPSGSRKRLRFRLNLDKAIGTGGSSFNPIIDTDVDHENTCGIEFLETYIEQDDSKTTDPTIWETEPKPTTDIDLFYEASNIIPITIDNNWDEQVLRPGMIVTTQGTGNTLDTKPGEDVILTNISGGNMLLMNANDTNTLSLADNAVLKFWDGNEYISVAVEGAQVGLYQGIAEIKIDPNFYNGGRTLPWFNCYSFGNGVESNRIRDDFNAVIIDKGARVSTISPEPYKEERRKHGLIYSGLYNSNSGVNNLNQFIQAEKITKDLNPTYGSIQKLFARKVSLVAFCEDRVIRILSNKDALYNADGKMQLTSTNRVLGEAQPFEGDYGISKNPESFAKESYRAYFTDKQRGAVLRLSMDGLTPISEAGMSDWFKDNLKLGDKLIGGFDDRKNHYNLTIKPSLKEQMINQIYPKTISYTETTKGWTSFKSFIPEDSVNLSSDYYTFKDGKLYKHYVPLKYDFNNNAWVDVDEENAENYNVFYGVNSYESTVKLLLNDTPSSIKSFKTLNYEGSQSKVDKFTTTTTIDAAGNTLSNIGDGNYYNLSEDIDPLTGLGLGYISGWHVSSIITDEQEGSVKEFIDKENKWYNYILGKPKTDIDIDAEEFSFQGIGISDSQIAGNVSGCTDPLALNYNPNANFDDGSCITVVVGCMDPSATNFDPLANTPGPCNILGCTDSLAFNFNPLATIPCCTACDGSDDNSCCIPVILGCTDPTMFNFNNYGPDPNVGLPLTGDPLIDVNTLDGSCIPIAVGCTDPLASNFNPGANTPCGPNGNNDCCIFPPIPGCTDPSANNYNPLAQVDDGSCTYNTGCMDDGNMGQTWWDTNYGTPVTYPGISHPGAYPLSNYDPTAVVDDGSCIYPTGCTDVNSTNYDPAAVIDDGSCIAIIYGCTDDGTDPNFPGRPAGYIGSASNYNASANTDDGSCTYDILGCTDPLAINYDPSANVDDGSCVICANINISVTTSITNATGPTYDNGMIEVFPTLNADDTPYTYVITNSTGSSNFGSYTGGNSTFFPNLPGDTYTVTITTANGCTDTVTVIVEDNITGCTDPQANNFNSLAIIEDGSCLYSGCTDPLSNNGVTFFNHPNPGALYTNPIAATVDDGSCVYTPGCMDPTAMNFDPAATLNDNTCIYEGCTDPTATNYGGVPAGPYQNGTMVDDGSCEYWGCMDTTATNYSTSATHDCIGTLNGTDVSCCTYCDSNSAFALFDFATYTSTSTTTESYLVGSQFQVQGLWNGVLSIWSSSWQTNTITWNNTYIYPGQNTTTNAATFSGSTVLSSGNNTLVLNDLPPGTYEMIVTESNGCTNTYTYTITEGIYGCIDPLATNYDPNATTSSNGSTNYNYVGGGVNSPVPDCIYSVNGCTDPTACNYNALASADDGSCQYCNNATFNTFNLVNQERQYSGLVVEGKIEVQGITNGVLGQPYLASAYPSGGGSLIDAFTDVLSATSHYDDLDIPSSSFATPVSTSSQIEVSLYPESCSPNNVFGNPISQCDSVPVVLSQDIYGCTDTNAWNYDPLVTIDGYSSSNTTSPCIECSDHIETINGAAVITPDSNATSVGGIDVDFNIPWTSTATTLSISGPGGYLNNVGNYTNQTTISLTGLLHGIYVFSFDSTRSHTQHDGTVVINTCSNTIQITVPNG